ncbi:OLC1v1013089C1 [Oldenlandia corymbosa var. corymbosa]|uniref:OLC1v1013089C1 n=1 Tax=Oldenlandia corymbosa var. corymbosa TaxID=529605 RepID=A0AAV1DXK7_OLDCO|nr:OLC1v1013089C1 [Oldenlandia corymbosa var. corymbosa]
MNHHQEFILETEEHSYFQSITYEDLPDCLECQKIGHDDKDCRHGKLKSTTVERQPQKPISVNKPKPKAPVVATTWKQKVVHDQNQEGVEKDKGPLTSELTEKDKEHIPTDIPSIVSPQRQNSSAKRRFTKEQLNAVLEKNKVEENLADPWDEEVPINQENRQQQLVLYQDPGKTIKLSERFHVLTDLEEEGDASEMEENLKETMAGHDSDGSHSDIEVTYSELQNDVQENMPSTMDDLEIG